MQGSVRALKAAALIYTITIVGLHGIKTVIHKGPQIIDWEREYRKNSSTICQRRRLILTLDASVCNPHPITHSHGVTVVRECCKVDDASQWENWKFDPMPRPNPLTDRRKKMHTSLRYGYLPTCKIQSRSLQGFLFSVCAKQRIKMFTRLLFFGSSNDLQPRRLNRFSRVIRQTTRFSARVCLFGARRQKFNIYTP